MELLSFVSNICDPGRSLFGIADVAHVSIQFGLQNCDWPQFMDNKRRPIVHYYDDLWAGCGCCGRGSGSGSKWLEGGCGFPIMVTGDGSDRV